MEEKMKYSTRQQKIILECLQEYGDTFYTIDQFMELLRGKEIQIGRTTVYRGLERLQKEGEEGRKKIGTITRFVTVGLGLLQSLAYFFFLRANGYLMKDASGAAFTGFDAVFQAVVIIAVLTAGTAVIMWLGEQITISGIGNGISIILFAGIVSRFPTLIKQLFQYLDTGRTVYKVLVPVVCVIFLLMIAYIVFMDNSERRLPIQYAKRVVGRKMYGGQSTHMPIKINMSGVLPIIFASSILSLPGTVPVSYTHLTLPTIA